MGELDFLKKKKQGKKEKSSDLFEDLTIDSDSDHPVHEEFVSEKGIREIKKKRLIKE
jgi:hypothetical protein